MSPNNIGQMKKKAKPVEDAPSPPRRTSPNVILRKPSSPKVRWASGLVSGVGSIAPLV